MCSCIEVTFKTLTGYSGEEGFSVATKHLDAKAVLELTTITLNAWKKAYYCIAHSKALNRNKVVHSALPLQALALEMFQAASKGLGELPKDVQTVGLGGLVLGGLVPPPPPPPEPPTG